MSGRRVLLAAPRYWPAADDVVTTVMHLADGLRAFGWEPEILAPRNSVDWPAEIVFRETPVHRVSDRSPARWRSHRLAGSVADWARQHISEFDLLYLVGFQRSSSALARIARRAGCPVVVRPLIMGPGGDWDWSKAAVGASIPSWLKLACRVMDAVVASTELMREELLASGLPADRIRYIPDGTPSMIFRTASLRHHARQVLADVNWDLKVPDFAPVVGVIGPFSRDARLATLIRAWEPLTDRWPSAAMWLIGDGPERTRLYDLVADLGIRHQVRLPGTFDDISDLLHAIDLFVCPLSSGGPRASLLQAMAAGLPIAAADIPLHREVLGTPACGLLFGADDEDSISQSLEVLIDQPEIAEPLGRAARRRATDRFSLEEMARAHGLLFDEIIEQWSKR